MVDTVTNYSGGEEPSIEANRTIKETEFIFAYMDKPLLLPQVYVIEGLGQSINLLSILWNYENIYGTIKNFSDAGLREVIKDQTSGDINNAIQRIGLLASVDITFEGVVEAGTLLSYSIHQSKIHGMMSHFKVEAYVQDQQIATGSMIGGKSPKLKNPYE